jgi:alpha 1,2-mannosyltransferase
MIFTFTDKFIRKTNYNVNAHTIALLRKGWQEYAAAIPPYPGNFEGKGIVTCAGGVNHVTCAWVNINMLRQTGCALPIELWYTGHELNAETIRAFEQLGVQCKNSLDYTGQQVYGFSLKPFAILNSSFKEVLFLDADNNCVTDPAYLFDDDLYKTYGTIFWPDYWITDKANPIWEITGCKDYHSIEQESGQILINKEKCWKEINVCMHFNLRREHYYEMLLGDKDTFRFAWRALGTHYNMIAMHAGACGFEAEDRDLLFGLTMVQHDSADNILFLHRNAWKWDISAEDELVWDKIRRFKSGAARGSCIISHCNMGESKGRTFYDLVGEVELLDFRELFGDYEQRCLAILKALRNFKFYTRFLLHYYNLKARPGYPRGLKESTFDHVIQRA